MLKRTLIVLIKYISNLNSLRNHLHVYIILPVPCILLRQLTNMALLRGMVISQQNFKMSSISFRRI